MLTSKILQECSFIIEFIKQAGEKLICKALLSILSSFSQRI